MTPLRDRTTWLHGDRFHCLQPPAARAKVWRLVLLGPPGVGKGTQAALLADALGACPLSTGDIFRTAAERSIAPGSPLAEAQERMNRGELVPDDVVLAMMRERRACLRCRGGFLLDGYPRTIAQAAALDGLLAAERLRLDAVISYDLPMTELVTRMVGRRVCHHCQALYHLLTRPPQITGVCDHCGGPLIQRTDDQLQPVRLRLAAYAEATARVADYYARQGLLMAVAADDDAQSIFERTLELLAAGAAHPTANR
ncbi:MAG TPA: nucleoside monophosphate kinase [Opitutaceae bacterium]|nr:nucleoside monophosphate kinase [Opitutaceae bacterium]